MEVRPIRPIEKIQVSKIQNIAFSSSRDFSQAQENMEEFQRGFETGRAAFDDQGKMCSCLELIPYKVRFDGHIVSMGGIGGVASLPEERKKRYIRHIFKYCMEEMYEKGYVFSYLYPFSHPYYRKFGYELNMVGIECSIPFSSLGHFEQGGDVRMYTAGMDTTGIITVYNQFIQDKNLSVVREEKQWESFFEKDPYKDNVFLYTWYDEEGSAKGYIQYSVKRAEDDEHEHDIKVLEFIWLNTVAFQGILAFLKNFSSHFNKIVWKSPHFVDILSFFPEPYQIEQQLQASGMNRVVNAQKALELMQVPCGNGNITIEIKDEFFTRNSAKYKVIWENGRLEVISGRDESDIICNINEFTQLVTGFSSVSQLNAAKKIELSGNPTMLNHLFAKKDLFLNDYF